MDIFALATKKKFRFETSKGLVSVEDLWELPLSSDGNRPNLDDIAKGLYKELKEDSNISFVNNTKAATTAFNQTKTKFDIVKVIIDTKLAEAESARLAKATKEKNQRILELIAQKDDEALASKSREELLAMLQE